MKILFATTTLPAGRITGGEVASAAFIDAMRDGGHAVEVVGFRRPGSEWEADAATTVVSERPIESREAGWRVGGWLLSALATRDGYSVAKFRSRSYRRMIADRLRSSPPDAVVIDHSQMGWLVPRGGLSVPVAFIAHNVEHQLYADAARRAGPVVGLINRRESRLVGRLERRLAATADRTWALSEADAGDLAALGAPSPRVFALPPAVSPPQARPAPAWDVGLLGTWSWDLNEAGLRWFLDEVRPLLGDATVAIAGAGSERFADESPPNVSCLGRVEDAARFLAASRVVAIPAVTTAGVQIKTLDAIACGSPVVATQAAMRGIERTPAIVSVADGAEAFANAIRHLLDAADPDADTAAVAEARRWVAERGARFREDVEAELEALVSAAS